MYNRYKQQPPSKPKSSTPSKYVVKQWENTNPPFAEGPSRYFIVGTTNSGKTTLAIRIIQQALVNPKDPMHQLVIISPNYDRDQKLQSLAQFAAQRGLTVRVYKAFDKKSITQFVAYMDGCTLKGMRSSVFIDDPIGMCGFTNNVNQQSPFNSFVSGAKHYNSNIYFSTQAIGGLSRSARKNVEVFIYLPDMISRFELYGACRFVHTFEEFDKLMDRYAGDAFHALWINVQFGRKGVYAINSQGQISAVTSVPS